MTNLFHRKAVVFPIRKEFDPKNKEHLFDFYKFLRYNTWGDKGCPYLLEDPYLDIPTMINAKITAYYLESIESEFDVVMESHELLSFS